MAIRNIRFENDPILRKKCRLIEKIDDKLKILVDDMYETMYKAEGVGLAAPQIGILKRVVVIDVGEGPVTLINPEIIKTSGKQVDNEGCLSIPGRQGEVERPDTVTVKALDIDGKEITVRGKELFARAICHELDHLDGVLFIDKVIKFTE